MQRALAPAEVSPLSDSPRGAHRLLSSPLLVLVVAGCASPRREPAPQIAEARTLEVPPAAAFIEPTGKFKVETWANAVNTHTLLDPEGRGAVPVSEARFLWGDGQLYVRFYAGDLDMQAHATAHDGPVWDDDSVTLAFFSDGRMRAIQISPTGIVADGDCPGDAAKLSDARCDLGWESGVRVAVDHDGSVNRAGDFDEEWAVEAAIPLSSVFLGGAESGARIRFALSRCEMATDGRRSCGSWGVVGAPGVLVLQPSQPLRK